VVKTKLILLVLAGSFISSSLLIANSVHLQAFAQAQEQLQLGIPGLIPPVNMRSAELYRIENGIIIER
jgi:hypothetical protein